MAEHNDDMCFYGMNGGWMPGRMEGRKDAREGGRKEGEADSPLVRLIPQD
jgi:hypothetical protein